MRLWAVSSLGLLGIAVLSTLWFVFLLARELMFLASVYLGVQLTAGSEGTTCSVLVDAAKCRYFAKRLYPSAFLEQV